jgi:hypothetical protein
MGAKRGAASRFADGAPDDRADEEQAQLDLEGEPPPEAFDVVDEPDEEPDDAPDDAPGAVAEVSTDSLQLFPRTWAA